MKPAAVRYYFDADILGLGKVVSGLRSDCTYPGDPGAMIHKRERPPCLIESPAVADSVWIPLATTADMAIVTRDRKIQRRVGERRAVLEHGARMFALVSEDAKTVWAQLEVLMTRWRSIEEIAQLPGPYIYRVSRTGSMRTVQLE